MGRDLFGRGRKNKTRLVVYNEIKPIAGLFPVWNPPGSEIWGGEISGEMAKADTRRILDFRI